MNASLPLDRLPDLKLVHVAPRGSRLSPTKSLNLALDNIDESAVTSPRLLNNHQCHSATSSRSSNELVDRESVLMNYSPKHSRKPSSLTSNRNINMKNLSLNLDDGTGGKDPHNVGDANFNSKNLSIAIPDDPPTPVVRNNGLPPPPSAKSQSTFKLSPTIRHPQSQPQSPVKKIPQMQTLQTTLTSKDYRFPESQLRDPSATQTGLQPVNSPRSDMNSPVESQLLTSFKSVNLNSRVPEELQELSQLNAYPEGPAKVLNDCIYLYSEPTIDEINHYDLVINVAKECKDLSAYFNPQNLPTKQYIHIPWSHTSSILQELPRLTEIMKRFDDLDTPGPHRKILVHCHCGVSRSACVIVAYYMCKFNISVNDAYELLKSGTNESSTNSINKLTYDKGYSIDTCSRICPNMSLIFELMDFQDHLSN